jgi:hypothetical protein
MRANLESDLKKQKMLSSLISEIFENPRSFLLIRLMRRQLKFFLSKDSDNSKITLLPPPGLNERFIKQISNLFMAVETLNYL